MNRHTQPGARNEALTAYAVDNLRQKADAKPVVQLFHEAFAAFPDNAELPRIYADYVSEKGMGEDSVLSRREPRAHHRTRPNESAVAGLANHD